METGFSECKLDPPSKFSNDQQGKVEHRYVPGFYDKTVDLSHSPKSNNWRSMSKPCKPALRLSILDLYKDRMRLHQDSSNSDISQKIITNEEEEEEVEEEEEGEEEIEISNSKCCICPERRCCMPKFSIIDADCSPMLDNYNSFKSNISGDKEKKGLGKTIDSELNHSYDYDEDYLNVSEIELDDDQELIPLEIDGKELKCGITFEDDEMIFLCDETNDNEDEEEEFKESRESELQDLLDGCFSIDNINLEELCKKYLDYGDNSYLDMTNIDETYGDENIQCYCKSPEGVHWGEIKKLLPYVYENEKSIKDLPKETYSTRNKWIVPNESEANIKMKTKNYYEFYGDIKCIYDGSFKEPNRMELLKSGLKRMWCLCQENKVDPNAGGDSIGKRECIPGYISSKNGEKCCRKTEKRRFGKRTLTSSNSQEQEKNYPNQMVEQNINCNHPFPSEGKDGYPDECGENFYDQEIDELFVTSSPVLNHIAESNDDDIYFEQSIDPIDYENSTWGGNSNFYTNELNTVSNEQENKFNSVTGGIPKILSLVDEAKPGAFAYRGPLGHREEELTVRLMSFENANAKTNIDSENIAENESTDSGIKTESDEKSVNANCNIEEIEFASDTESESSEDFSEEDSENEEESTDICKAVNECLLDKEAPLAQNTGALYANVHANSGSFNGPEDVRDFDNPLDNNDDEDSSCNSDDSDDDEPETASNFNDEEDAVVSQNNSLNVSKSSQEDTDNLSTMSNVKSKLETWIASTLSPRVNAVHMDENKDEKNDETERPQSVVKQQQRQRSPTPRQRSPTPRKSEQNLRTLSPRVAEIKQMTPKVRTPRARTPSPIKREQTPKCQLSPAVQSNASPNCVATAVNHSVTEDTTPQSKGMFSFKPPNRSGSSSPDRTVAKQGVNNTKDERPSYVLSSKERKIIMEKRYGKGKLEKSANPHQKKAVSGGRRVGARRSSTPKSEPEAVGDHGEKLHFNPIITKREIEMAKSVVKTIEGQKTKKKNRFSHIEELKDQTKNIRSRHLNRKSKEIENEDNKTGSNWYDIATDGYDDEMDRQSAYDHDVLAPVPEKNFVPKGFQDGKVMDCKIEKKILVPKGYTMQRKIEPEVSEDEQERREKQRAKRREMMANLSSKAKDYKPKIESDGIALSPIPNVAAQIAHMAKEEYMLQKPSAITTVQKNVRPAGGTNQKENNRKWARNAVNKATEYPWASEKQRQKDFYKKYGDDQSSMDSPFSHLFEEKPKKSENKPRRGRFANERYRTKKIEAEVDPYDIKLFAPKKSYEQEEEFVETVSVNRSAALKDLTHRAKTLAKERNTNWKKPKAPKKDYVRSPTQVTTIKKDNRMEEIITQPIDVTVEENGDVDHKYKMTTFKINSSKDKAQIIPVGGGIKQASGEDIRNIVTAVNLYKAPVEPEKEENVPPICTPSQPKEEVGMLSKFNPFKLFFKQNKRPQHDAYRGDDSENFAQQQYSQKQTGGQGRGHPGMVNGPAGEGESMKTQEKDLTARTQGSSVDVANNPAPVPVCQEPDDWKTEFEILKQKRKEKLKNVIDSKRRKEEKEIIRETTENKRYNRDEQKHKSKSATPDITTNGSQRRSRWRQDPIQKHNFSNNCLVVYKKGQSSDEKKAFTPGRPKIDVFASQNSNNNNSRKSSQHLNLKERLEGSFCDGIEMQGTLQLLIEWYIVCICVLFVMFMSFLCPCAFSKIFACPLPSICTGVKSIIMLPIDIVTGVFLTTSTLFYGSKPEPQSTFSGMFSSKGSKKEKETHVETPPAKSSSWVFADKDEEEKSSPPKKPSSWIFARADEEEKSSPSKKPSSWIFARTDEVDQSSKKPPAKSSSWVFSDKDEEEKSSHPKKSSSWIFAEEEEKSTDYSGIIDLIAWPFKQAIDLMNAVSGLTVGQLWPAKFASSSPRMFEPGQDEELTFTDEQARKLAKLRKAEPILHVFLGWEKEDCDMPSLTAFWRKHIAGTYPAHCQ